MKSVVRKAVLYEVFAGEATYMTKALMAGAVEQLGKQDTECYNDLLGSAVCLEGGGCGCPVIKHRIELHANRLANWSLSEQCDFMPRRVTGKQRFTGNRKGKPKQWASCA